MFKTIPCDDRNLKEKTEDYWRALQDPRQEDKLPIYKEKYVAKLLPLELQCIAARPALVPREECRTLVLTVGYSPEPLLQAICIFRPQHVIWLANRLYNKTRPGDQMCNRMEKLVKLLPDVTAIPDQFRLQQTPEFSRQAELEDTPASVFSGLHRALQGVPGPIVVDITGAKKSMMSGAFLYAAFAGLPISYVDFEEYDPNFGRPYGFLGRVGIIPDPYHALQLREWEQVEQLYTRGMFRQARERLEGAPTGDGTSLGRSSILWSMSRPLRVGSQALADPDVTAGPSDTAAGEAALGQEGRLFGDDALEATRRLARLLRVYEMWDAGDYSGAWEHRRTYLADIPDDLVPWPIRELGQGSWPRVQIDVSGHQDHIETNARVRQAATELLNQHLELKTGESRVANATVRHITPTDSLFAKPRLLMAYVYDERQKIGGLISAYEDYRSAFLRAAALHEFLLKARLALTVLNGAAEVERIEKKYLTRCTAGKVEQIEEEQRTPITSTDNDWGKVFRHIVNDTSVEKLVKTLHTKAPHSYPERTSKTVTKLYQVSLDRAPTLDDYWSDKTFALMPFRQGDDRFLISVLRGEAVHTHLFLPRSVAQAALALLNASITEFEQGWLAHFHPGAVQDQDRQVAAPAWQDALTGCGITFLPSRYVPDLDSAARNGAASEP